MALIYTRSTAKTAKGYSRTENMESNPGVATLAIINPGKRQVDRNPYQWISGRGKKHQHVSPSYKSMKGAADWGKKRETGAKLYPVDDRGTILGRPISRRNQMAYNIGALRRRRRGRRMRRNSHAELLKAARAIDVGRSTRKSSKRSSKRRSRRGRARSTVTARTERVTMPGRRRRSRKTSRKSSKRSTAARKAARTRAAKKLARSLAAKKAARTRRKRSGRKTSRKRRSSKRRSSRKTSRRRSSKRRGSKRRSRRGSKRRRSSKRRSRRGSKRRGSKRRSRRGSKRRRRSRRRSGGYYYMGKKIGRPGIKGLESYFARGIAPQVTRLPRLFNRPKVTSYGYGAHLAKISRRGKTSRRRGARRTSKKTSRRRSSRRTSMAANRRRRRRRSRRLRSNMLAQRRGRGKGRTSGRGRLMQVVQLGPRSRRRGYPVTVAQHTIGNAYLRKFKFGGIAKRKHLSKRGSMAANRRRSRRVSRNMYVLAANRGRRRRRRRSMRRNAYVIGNRGRRRSRRRRSMKSNRRRLRRNSVLGLSVGDLSSVLRPTIAGAAGFVGARIAGNAAMRIPFVARLGDWGGILTDLALAAVTLTVGDKVTMIRQNQSALVVGMGLDAVDRLLRVVHIPILSDTMAAALPGPSSVLAPATAAPTPEGASGFGAYIDVSHAGAPYKGMLGVGEYVEQPMGDAGIFSSNVFDGMTGG